MNKIFFKKIIIALVLATFFGLVSKPAQAAIVFFEQHPDINGTVNISVSVDTAGVSLNTFEATLKATDFTIQSIVDGNSIVNFWLEKPEAKEGSVHFSGIIPGGYTGANGHLFTVIGVSKSPKAKLEITDSRAFRNDGTGTEVKLDASRFIIGSIATNTPVRKQVDVVRPEIFAPEIGQSEGLYDNKWFIAFATQDKGSGIDHYEIAEVSPFHFFGSYHWQLASSPYLLQDQNLTNFIYIKAVDKEKNVQIVKVYPQHKSKLYLSYLIWVILIGIVLGSLAQVFMLWRKRKSRKLKK
jgi:hypothetical protein